MAYMPNRASNICASPKRVDFRWHRANQRQALARIFATHRRDRDRHLLDPGPGTRRLEPAQYGDEIGALHVKARA